MLFSVRRIKNGKYSSYLRVGQENARYFMYLGTSGWCEDKYWIQFDRETGISWENFGVYLLWSHALVF